MPRLGLLSDIHWEAQSEVALEMGSADALACVGDVWMGEHALQGLERLIELSNQTQKPIFFVPGNHEFEGGSIAERVHAFKIKTLDTQVHVLYNEKVLWEGYEILGTTLWSNFELFGKAQKKECMEWANQHCKDLQSIQNMLHFPLHAQGALYEHQHCMAFLADHIGKSAHPQIVLSHFAPSIGSLLPRYAKQKGSAYYVSALEEWVEQIHLWCHGHIHASFDYHVGPDPKRGRVVANAKGFVMHEYLPDYPPDTQEQFRRSLPGFIDGDWIHIPENPSFENPKIIDLEKI